MRGCMLFVAGLTIGLTVQTVAAQNLTPNRGLVGLNHVGVAVPNLNEAIDVLHEDTRIPRGVPEPRRKGAAEARLRADQPQHVRRTAAGQSAGDRR